MCYIAKMYIPFVSPSWLHTGRMAVWWHVYVIHMAIMQDRFPFQHPVCLSKIVPLQQKLDY